MSVEQANPPNQSRSGDNAGHASQAGSCMNNDYFLMLLRVVISINGRALLALFVLSSNTKTL